VATTGFWPVKGKLSEVIDYAANPDKTTDPRYLDADLAAVVRYAANDSKTDQKLYVSAINCPVKTACQQMMATKRRFGKTGGNVAYHGYQSFRTGEVTPEEAHQIGMETARRMWGREYEIVVTTHLNTDNIHNHIVVNSVSFRTGRKFENHISDHYRLREISDDVCRERGKSVLEHTDFYSKGKKKEYWVHKNGGLTHWDILRRDLDEAISKTTNWRAMDSYLAGLGYRYARSSDYAHPALIAPGWKRPVRIDSLGSGYTQEQIRTRLIANLQDVSLYRVAIYRPTRRPLLEIEEEYRRLQRMNGMQLVFEIVIALFRLMTGNQEQAPVRSLSPAMRQEVRKLDETLKQYKLLCENHIDSPEELASFIEKKSAAVSDLEDERRLEYNRCRRPKSDEDKERHKAAARAISAELNPLRDELATARKIVERYPKLLELLETERAMEQQIKIRERERLER
jgi:hypothetical protein